MVNIRQKISSLIIPAVLLAVIIYLRFASFPLWQALDYDQEIGLVIVRSLVVDHKIVTIGPQASIAGVFIGPYFYYLTAPIFLLTKMNPAAMVVSNILNSILLLSAIYLIAKKLFNSKVALLSLIIYGCSAYLTSFDRNWWNPMLMPLVSLLTFYATYQYLKVKKTFWLLVGAVSSASLLHLHLSGFIIIAFYFLSLLIWGRKLIWNNKKTLPLIVAVYFMFLAPLIVYDLRHNLFNTHQLINFVLGVKDEESIKKGFTIVSRDSSFLNNLQIFISLFGAIITDHVDRVKGTLAGIIITIAIAFSFWKKKRLSLVGQLFLLQIALTFIFIMFNGGSFLPYYLQSAFPITVILLALGISLLPRVAIVAVIALFLFVNIPPIVNYRNPLGLTAKQEILEFIKEDAGSGDYVIDFVFNDPRTPLRFGFNYLFWYYGMQGREQPATSGQVKYKIVVPASQMESSRLTKIYGDIGVIKELTP